MKEVLVKFGSWWTIAKDGRLWAAASTLAILIILATAWPGMAISPGELITQTTPASPEDLDSLIYLPLVARPPALFTVSGHVRDAGNHPLAGATILDSSGQTATTNAQGFYTLRLYAGGHALAPSLNGYLFAPSVQEINLTSDVSGQDFVALQADVEAIVNGGFETNTWWAFPASEWPAAYASEIVHGGARSARTGILSPTDNRYSYSSVLSPAIAIPAGSSNVTLRLWLYPISGEGAADWMLDAGQGPNSGEAALAYDAQYVQVLDSSGALLENLMWTRKDERMWTYHEFNLTKWAGGTIKLQFGSYNDGSNGVTAMYVDDASLQISSLDTDPTACANYLGNSGFENITAWGIPITEYSAGYSTDYAYAGVRSMRTGIPLYASVNRYSYSDAYQDVTIPLDAGSALLKMQLLPKSQEAVYDGAPEALEPPPVGAVWGEAPLAYDAQYVLVLNPYTGVIRETLLWWQPRNSAAWIYRAFDLSHYRGQRIRLQFGTYNDGYGGRTVMYADEIYVEICTAAPPPTPTPTPPAPPACGEQVRNGGFEVTGDWRIPITEYSAGYSTFLKHSGARSMRTGIYYPVHNRYSYSDVRQSVYIPYGASQATLGFWSYALSGESYMADPVLAERPTAVELGAEAMAGDVQYLLVLDVYNNWIDTLLWQRRNDGYWRYLAYDLRRFAGREIKLQFGTYNNGWDGVTSMYVDDVSLWVCP
jgi:hypothetical protein